MNHIMSVNAVLGIDWPGTSLREEFAIVYKLFYHSC